MTNPAVAKAEAFAIYEENALIAIVKTYPGWALGLIAGLTVALIIACYMPGVFAGCV